MSHPTTHRQSPLLPIFLLSATGFTVLTTEFVIVGLLPAMARDLQVSVAKAGLLVTLFAFTVALVGPFLTALMARFERKRLFVATMLLFGISNVIAAMATNFEVMAVARIIPAFALPVFWSLASDTAVEITGPERAGKAISMVSFGIVAAMIFGIPVGTLISDAFGWRTAFWVLAAMSFLKAIGLHFFLPTIRTEKKQDSFSKQLGIARSPMVVGHVMLSLLVFAGMFTAYTYLADTLEKIAGFDGKTVGWILMGFGGMGLLGNWLGGKAVDKGPLGATILFAAPMVLVMSAVVAIIHSHTLLAVGLAFWGLAQAALFTISHVRVMKTASQNPALGASLNISGANAGIGIGAIIGGRVIETNGLANVNLAAAGVILLAIGLAFVLKLAKTPALVDPTGATCD